MVGVLVVQKRVIRGMQRDRERALGSATKAGQRQTTANLAPCPGSGSFSAGRSVPRLARRTLGLPDVTFLMNVVTSLHCLEETLPRQFMPAVIASWGSFLFSRIPDLRGRWPHHSPEVTFNPMAHPTTPVISKSRMSDTGSPNQIIPITTVPVAPTPVQTA